MPHLPYQFSPYQQSLTLRDFVQGKIHQGACTASQCGLQKSKVAQTLAHPTVRKPGPTFRSRSHCDVGVSYILPSNQGRVCCRNQNSKGNSITVLELVLQLQQSQDLEKDFSFFLITANDWAAMNCLKANKVLKGWSRINSRTGTL